MRWCTPYWTSRIPLVPALYHQGLHMGESVSCSCQSAKTETKTTLNYRYSTQTLFSKPSELPGFMIHADQTTRCSIHSYTPVCSRCRFCEACLGDGGIPAIVEAENRSKFEQQLRTCCCITMDSGHKTDLGFSSLRDLQIASDLKSPDSSNLSALTQTDPRGEKNKLKIEHLKIHNIIYLSTSSNKHP